MSSYRALKRNCMLSWFKYYDWLKNLVPRIRTPKMSKA